MHGQVYDLQAEVEEVVRDCRRAALASEAREHALTLEAKQLMGRVKALDQDREALRDEVCACDLWVRGWVGVCMGR